MISLIDFLFDHAINSSCLKYQLYDQFTFEVNFKNIQTHNKHIIEPLIQF